MEVAHWDYAQPDLCDFTGGTCESSQVKIQFNPQKIATKGFSTDSGRFLARDSMLSALYAMANPSVRPSVCLSVTRVDQSKTVEGIIEILSPSDRPNILVF